MADAASVTASVTGLGWSITSTYTCRVRSTYSAWVTSPIVSIWSTAERIRRRYFRRDPVRRLRACGGADAGSGEGAVVSWAACVNAPSTVKTSARYPQLQLSFPLLRIWLTATPAATVSEAAIRVRPPTFSIRTTAAPGARRQDP
ncbi:hypothetical protein [Actinomadura madurae]|uniref:hypothetical protein n=1 Tax=Actinomadura madurae TaxID=1993 RepID=UPI0020D1FD38|nr:hypothetical protein [Actinomadura madurae]MCQ0015295.1 hypothetical protein [Actinomadura madurae]